MKNAELEHTLAAVVENLSEGVVVTDFNGHIIYVNKAIELSTGYSRHELIGGSPGIINGEEDAETIQKEITATMQRSGRWCREMVQKRKDGSTYLAELEIFPVLDDEGTSVAWSGIQRDITKRKQMENALRESEIKFRTLEELDIICQTNAEGIIEYISPSNKSILGYGPEDMLGRSVLQFVHPDDKLKVMNAIQSAKDTLSPGKTEYRYIHANGHYLWLESVGNLLYDENSRISGAIFCTRDISERKQAEESLRQSEERYRRLIELSPYAIAVHSEGKIVFINKAGAKIYGENPEELIGKPVMDFVHPDYRGIVSERWRQIQEEGQNVPLIEEKFILSDGSVVDVEVAAVSLTFQGKPAIQVVVRDITERKQMEEELRSREQFLNSMFESMQDRLSVIDTEFNIIRTNGKVENSYAHELPLIGKKCYKVYHGEDEVCAGCPGLKAIGNREPAHSIISVRDPSGNNKGWLDHYCYPFIDMATGELAGVIVYARDITEKLRVEQEMARMERFHLVGQMAAGIGHEIRNPMTAVRGFLQLLGGKREYARYKEYFQLMLSELDRANSIITEYLSLARNKPVGLVEHNLGSILAVLRPLLMAEALDVGIDLSIEQGDVPKLPLNENEIRQLILNLVKNGMEAMDYGGKLEIKTYSENGEVILSVKDHGTGIRPEIMEKLGTPFLTTKDKGTGLGLAVCYGIAARHNAAITVDTGPAGTTFLVRFRL